MNIPKSILNAVKSRRKSLTKSVEAVLNGKRVNDTMRFTFLGDVVDHLKLFSLLEKGHVKRAADFCMDLDTDSREHIPNVIYNYLEHYGIEKIYLD